MSHRAHLPQLDGGLFLTDAGLETDLIFNKGMELPEFAAFDLLKDEQGTQVLRDYYVPYLETAREKGAGFVLESPTWRANPDWAQKIGHDVAELDALNRRAIELLEGLRSEYEGSVGPIVISGCVGPQDDGYNPGKVLDADAAQDYHSTQVTTFDRTEADMVTAITMTYVSEAIGVARAAAGVGIPSAISFTVETDGRLPSGQPLGEAIEEVDAATRAAPAYYMINCAHPTHFETVLDGPGAWRDRVHGLRANASTMSHAELDEAEELDDGDPADLAERYAALKDGLPELNVLGGCCGTDHRHVAAIAERWG
ncbi:MAG: homocysteine S-methyltransferase family protein [Thermoleophilaceae bacterium]|nr:homocysteine S-methyltransferase family protein [Thermoleophilaceae bacterium]